MKNIYACLIGNWVNLCDDPNCKMGPNHASPQIWWEENAEIWSPLKKKMNIQCTNKITSILIT
ncbi:hypothetical protein LZD60_08050 [Clostridium perfringens]|nr:hypothetical protein LZD60_08050 [Clostridium perfringens]